MQIVIDTNIWKKACTSESFDCLMFISNFMQTPEDSLAVDYSYSMLNEYEDNVKEEPLYKHFIGQLHREKRVEYGPSDIPRVYKAGLDRVGFHEPEDRVFLGRAYHADKYLVTEDSDYGLSPDQNKNDDHALAKKDYIENTMGVKLVNSENALSESRSRMTQE